LGATWVDISFGNSFLCLVTALDFFLFLFVVDQREKKHFNFFFMSLNKSLLKNYLYNTLTKLQHIYMIYIYFLCWLQYKERKKATNGLNLYILRNHLIQKWVTKRDMTTNTQEKKMGSFLFKYNTYFMATYNFNNIWYTTYNILYSSSDSYSSSSSSDSSFLAKSMRLVFSFHLPRTTCSPSFAKNLARS